jgi:hypothetical protein
LRQDSPAPNAELAIHPPLWAYTALRRYECTSFCMQHQVKFMCIINGHGQYPPSIWTIHPLYLVSCGGASSTLAMLLLLYTPPKSSRVQHTYNHLVSCGGASSALAPGSMTMELLRLTNEPFLGERRPGRRCGQQERRLADVQRPVLHLWGTVKIVSVSAAPAGPLYTHHDATKRTLQTNRHSVSIDQKMGHQHGL